MPPKPPYSAKMNLDVATAWKATNRVLWASVGKFLDLRLGPHRRGTSLEFRAFSFTPRALETPRCVMAINFGSRHLTALSDSRWPALATLAATMRRALLAVPDHAPDSSHGEAHDVMAAARDLLATLRPDGAPLPFATLARLHHAVARHPRFAPQERAATMAGVRDHRLLADRPPPSPRVGRSKVSSAITGRPPDGCTMRCH